MKRPPIDRRLAGVNFVSDHVYALEVDDGACAGVLSSDDSVRVLTVDIWIIADKAARLRPDLISLRSMWNTLACVDKNAVTPNQG